jgi:hypothetical protein
MKHHQTNKEILCIHVWLFISQIILSIPMYEHLKPEQPFLLVMSVYNVYILTYIISLFFVPNVCFDS